MLLDCFSIPVSMVMSRVLLGARYGQRHFLGVLLCVIGLSLTVINDLGELQGYHHHWYYYCYYYCFNMLHLRDECRWFDNLVLR